MPDSHRSRLRDGVPRGTTSAVATSRIALLLTMLLIEGCSCPGDAARCQTSNCTGCCSTLDVCVSGDTLAACGTGGFLCIACPAGQSCAAGVCTPPAADAGGLPCQATCDGCCTDPGSVCLPGADPFACGARGERCVTCIAAQVCAAGTCVDPACPGCIEATSGACLDGGTSTACGLSGVACQACVSGASCDQAGRCVGGACPGCVDFQGVCQPGNLKAGCGKAAEACVTCLPAQYCAAGACANVDGGACRGPAAACGVGADCCSLVCAAGQCGLPPMDAGALDAGSCPTPCTAQPIALSPACEPCVATVCGTDMYCCATRWDAQCAGEAKSKCGSRCQTADAGTRDGGATDAGPPDAGLPDAGVYDGGSSGPLTCSSPAPYDTQNWVNMCGTERWAIKTGTDGQAQSVNLRPQTTTIVQLSAIPAPPNISTSMRYGPTELTTWRLNNVKLTLVKMETDSDYHTVVSDGTNTMIVEIPYPGCVGAGSPFACLITHARGAVDGQVSVTSAAKMPNLTVSVVGVGMFDFDHSQTGKAPNGIELHPVLGICFGQNCQL